MSSHSIEIRFEVMTDLSSYMAASHKLENRQYGRPKTQEELITYHFSSLEVWRSRVLYLVGMYEIPKE